MNLMRVWLLLLLVMVITVPYPFDNFLGTVAGFTGAQFIGLLIVMALTYTEAMTPSGRRGSWGIRERTIQVGHFKHKINGVEYDIHIHNKDIDVIPTKTQPPPEPTRPPTPMDNVLVRIQGRVNALSGLENAEITPDNAKVYDGIAADLTKISEEVERAPSLKNSDQYNDYVQAITLANELLVDVGARFGK